MTGGQILLTTLEVLTIAAIILGLIFEPKIAAWEGKIFSNIKRKLSIKRRK